MWVKLGRVPPSYMDKATDTRHGYYNFHMEAQYAINDFINLYLYNYAEDYSQTSVQFTGQDYYFTVVHTTDKLLGQMTSDLKMLTNRDCNWYSRKDVYRQFQIKGERIGREGAWKIIIVGKYMELKATYKQKHRNV
eukprot:4283572-Amphidinium_carterae.2